jgi:hypothetical protein
MLGYTCYEEEWYADGQTHDDGYADSARTDYGTSPTGCGGSRTATLPTLHDAPAEMQAELMRMTWLDSQELWRIAQGQMSAEAQEQLQQLIHLHEQRPLTVEEQAQLDALRQEYGRMTLLKARAYALLSLRGGAPLLSRL